MVRMGWGYLGPDMESSWRERTGGSRLNSLGTLMIEFLKDGRRTGVGGASLLEVLIWRWHLGMPELRRAIGRWPVARVWHLVRCLGTRRRKPARCLSRRHREAIIRSRPLGRNHRAGIVETWGYIPRGAIEHALKLARV